jgi:hypothetical protein
LEHLRQPDGAINDERRDRRAATRDLQEFSSWFLTRRCAADLSRWRARHSGA